MKKDILELISKENKSELGKYNREVVKKYYSVEKMTDDCEKAYLKTVKSN